MIQTIVQKITGRSATLRAAEHRFIIIALVPTILFYLIVKFYPIFFAFFISMHEWSLFGNVSPFVGLDNYALLAQDSLFFKVMWNTMYRTFAGTFLGAFFALVVALILNPIKRGSILLRLVYFLPVMTSVIASATIWKWMLQTRFGLLNQLLSILGVPPVPWLQSTTWAMPSVIVMGIWGGIGFTVIIYLAGLRGIPRDYYESAEIDGANSLQLAFKITLPLLKPVVSFVLITGVIGGFSGGFQAIYMMTGGGPLDSTRVLALHIYDYAFERLFMGQAASMSFVLFAIVLILTLVQFKLQRIDWEL